MIKLLKYELLRRKQLLIGAAISMLIVEGVALLGIYMGSGLQGRSGWNALAVGMTALLVVGGSVLAFLDGVIKVYSDFKHKHGYMVFMTPQNGYRVMWAKTIFAVLEVLAAALVIAGCLALSGTVADNLYGSVISKFFAELEIYPYAGIIFGCAGLGILQLIAQLSIALLAVTVSRAMTRGSSYNWLIALVMYFALAFVVNFVNGWLLLLCGVAGDVIRMANETVVFDSGLFIKYFIIGAATYLAWFAGCTTLSGRLVNRGIDL